MPALASFDNTFRFWTEWHGAGRFAAVFVFTLLVSWLAKTLLFRAIGRFTAKTETDLDDNLLSALRAPARYWVVLLALVVAVSDINAIDVPPRIVNALSLSILILLAVSMSIAIARVSILLLQHTMERSSTGIEITTLTKLLIRVFWAVPALLVVLRALHIDISLALTTLGVGGIAVSLALKDTLANVFSGFYVSLSGHLHKGDFIRIDTGIEGYVLDIHWRVTTLRTLANNLVLLPNSKLSEAVVVNFSQPAKPLSVSINYGVAYATDLDRLDEVVIEEVRNAVGEIPGLLAVPAPSNRLNPGFGDSALQFTLSVGVAELEQQYAVTDLLRRRLLKRFRVEGIQLPFPTRTVEIVNPGGAPGEMR